MEPPIKPPVEPPVEPPIEPIPPVEPPAPGDSREWWQALCADPRTIACTEFGSPKEVHDRAYLETGVPNTSASPLVNGKCRLNGGDRDCYPAFGSNVTEAGVTYAEAVPDLFTCEKRREYIEEFGQSHEITGDRDLDILRSSLWSPCYEAEWRGVLMTEWSHPMNSSLNHIEVESWPDRPAVGRIIVNYEIALHESFFRPRKGSVTAKHYRIEVLKGACQSELLDGRFLQILPEYVDIGFGHWCGGDYSDDASTLRVERDGANRWIRITRDFDHPNGVIRSEAVDSETGAVLMDAEQSTKKDGSPFTFPTSVSLVDLRILLHSTAKKSCESAEDCEQYPPGAFLSRYWSVQVE